MTLRLYAYIKGKKRSSFPILIQSSKTVGELKEAISEEASDVLWDVYPYRLVLYKVDLPDGKDPELWVSQNPKEELKAPSYMLSTIFSTTPPEGIVSIFVETPEDSGEGDATERC
jgi:hypothetical protein